MVPNVSVIGSVADSGFNPKWIPNLTLWLDASDGSTMYNSPTGSVLCSHSESVGRWEDKSGNNWHAYQFTASRRPRYMTSSVDQRVSVLNFVAIVSSSFELTSSAYGILTNKSESSFFAVASGSRGGNGIIGIRNANTTGSTLTDRYAVTGLGNYVNVRTRRVDSGALSTGPDRGPAFPLTQSGATYAISHVIRYNASSSRLYVNGALSVLASSSYTASYSSYSGSTSNTDSVGVNIGTGANSTGFLTGSLCEILFYDRALSDSERRSVERYLHRKWNVRTYDQKVFRSSDLYSDLALYVDANDIVSNPGSGSVWYDLSGNNRTGSLESGAVFQTLGGISYVNCDGTDDNVNFGNVLNYTTESFSFAGWFWVDSDNASDPATSFINKGDFQQDGYYLTGNATNGQFELGFNQSGQFRNAGNNLSFQGVTAFTKDVWNFLGFTRNGTTFSLTMNLNGVETLNFNNILNFSPQSSTRSLRLATWPGYATTKMRIGMFSSFTRALTPQEMLELYHATKNKFAKFD